MLKKEVKPDDQHCEQLLKY